VTDARLQAAIDELYAAPLEAFTAERTRIARELRAAGERPAAAEVARLPKPSPPAWALNHVARAQPQTVAAWLESARALREASANAARVGGDAIRAASAEHRAATAGLLALVRVVEPAGRRLSEPMVDRVRALLNAATADAAVAEALRAARLTEDAARRAEVVEAAAPAPSGPGPAAPGEPEIDREAEARARRRAELSRRIAAATEAAQRAREEVAAREQAAGAADARLEEARRTLHRTESEAAAAHAAAADAHAAAAAAERELEQLRRDLRREGG
jgi:hypothetical protein